MNQPRNTPRAPGPARLDPGPRDCAPVPTNRADGLGGKPRRSPRPDAHERPSAAAAARPRLAVSRSQPTAWPSSHLVVGLVTAALVVLAPAPSAAQAKKRSPRAERSAPRPPLAGLALPPGSRVDQAAPGAYRSGRNLRQSVEFYKRLLKRRGVEYREIPTYQRRGVLVARLLPREPDTRWAAIHVWKSGSQTRIAIVPKSDLTPAQ